MGTFGHTKRVSFVPITAPFTDQLKEYCGKPAGLNRHASGDVTFHEGEVFLPGAEMPTFPVGF